jgi:hypothetical protein
MSTRSVHSDDPASAPRDAILSAGWEPALSEILAEPLVHLVMRRDGVSLPSLRALIGQAQARLAGKAGDARGLCRGCPA